MTDSWNAGGRGQSGKCAVNDITGKKIRTGGTSDAFRKGWDTTFGTKEHQGKLEPTPDTSD